MRQKHSEVYWVVAKMKAKVAGGMNNADLNQLIVRVLDYFCNFPLTCPTHKEIAGTAWARDKSAYSISDGASGVGLPLSWR